MDGSEVPRVPVSALPLEFGAAAALLDVREDDEWTRGHPPGAQHVPMAEIPARMGEIDPDKDLYVICHTGGRSYRVALYLVRNGFEPIHVEGGMLAWQHSGRPVITDDGAPGVV
jgi:rhodanese-related sulfurtransferase